jgi:hypothetical protein
VLATSSFQSVRFFPFLSIDSVPIVPSLYFCSFFFLHSSCTHLLLITLYWSDVVLFYFLRTFFFLSVINLVEIKKNLFSKFTSPGSHFDPTFNVQRHCSAIHVSSLNVYSLKLSVLQFSYLISSSYTLDVARKRSRLHCVMLGVSFSARLNKVAAFEMSHRFTGVAEPLMLPAIYPILFLPPSFQSE